MNDRLQAWLDSKLSGALEWTDDHALVVLLYAIVALGVVLLGNWALS